MSELKNEPERPAFSRLPENEIKQGQEKHQKTVFRIKVVVILFAVFFGVWFVFLRSVPLRISKETTWITVPRTADGKSVDYLKAFEQLACPPQMQTGDNGYRLIVQHFSVPDLPPECRDQYFEKLGLPATTIPDMTFEEQYTFLNRNKHLFKSDLFKSDDDRIYFGDSLAAVPWTLEQYPFMQKWLDENARSFDVLAEAVRKPVYSPPVVVGGKFPLLTGAFTSNWSQQRDFARGLSARACYHIGSGKIDAAIDDILTITRLGRRMEQMPSGIPVLVGIAIEGVDNAIGPCSNLDALPSRAQLQRMYDEYQNLPPRVSVEDLLKGERLEYLDAVQYMIQRRNVEGLVPSRGGSRPLVDQLFPWIGIDENVVMKRFNSAFDSGTVLTAEPTFSALFLLKKRSEYVGDVFVSLLLPPLDTFKEVLDREKCSDNLKLITLAMLLYHEDHGTLPPAFTVDANGKPLQSWRVLLLPYLGEKELFEQIRLNEPWDSEHNRQFHSKIPAVYQCPSASLQESETAYTVVVGEKTAFDNSGTGKKLADFGPKSTDLILVTEARTPFCWMSPNDAATKIGGNHGSCNAGLRSGAVMFLLKSTEPSLWQAMLEGTLTEREFREMERKKTQSEE
ncbi:MAG: DUF1559 domain-containing protein [Planctomycetaceae bacterium]|nr:DUF1559 domain-containing protein [Planctomycetaceae bacterium]